METGNQINEMRIADNSPEKAGVGGSIPSLATVFKNLRAHLSKFGCIWLHFGHTHCTVTVSFTDALTNAVNFRTALRCASGTTC